MNIFSQGILSEWIFSYGYSRISYLEFVVVTSWYCRNLNNWMSTNLCEDCGKSACWWCQVGLGSQVCSASGYLVPAPQGHWPCVNTFHVPYLEVCVCLLYSIPLRRTLSPHISSLPTTTTRTMYSCPWSLSSLSTSAENIFDYTVRLFNPWFIFYVLKFQFPNRLGYYFTKPLSD